MRKVDNNEEIIMDHGTHWLTYNSIIPGYYWEREGGYTSAVYLKEDEAHSALYDMKVKWEDDLRGYDGQI